MRRLTTSNEAMGPGVMVVQTREYDSPPLGGAPWELHLRPAIWLARIRDQHRPDTSTGGKALGHYDVDREEIGDLLGALLWERDKRSPQTREIPGWHWAWPVVQESEEDAQSSDVHEYGERPDTLRLRAIYTIDETSGLWLPDERLARLRAQLPKLQSQDDAWPLPAAGMYGVVVGAVDESRQQELWQRTDPRLVLPWRGGRGEHSEIVHDCVDPDRLDEDRRGRLAALVVVGGRVGGWQPAICGTGNDKGGSGAGFAAIVLKPDGAGGGQSVVPGSTPAPQYATALGSHEMQGLFHPGHRTDRHKLGEDPDGAAVNPLHLWHRFLVYRDQERDGPFELRDKWQEGSGGPPKIAFRAWDTASKEWKIQAHGDIYGPPFTPPTEPPADGPPTDLPPRPNDKIPPHPGRYPYELRVPSLYIDGTREEDQTDTGSDPEPYDGRLGPGDPDHDPTAIDGTTQRERPIVGHLWGHTSWDTTTGRYETLADTGTSTGDRWLGGRVPSGDHCLVAGSATELPDGSSDGVPGRPERLPSAYDAARDRFRVHVLGVALSVGTSGRVSQGKRTEALHLTSDRNGGRLYMTDDVGAEDGGLLVECSPVLRTNGRRRALRVVAASASAEITDDVVVVRALAANATISLPDTPGNGTEVTIVCRHGGKYSLTVAPTGAFGSDTIEAGSSYPCVNNKTYSFIYDSVGADWVLSSCC